MSDAPRGIGVVAEPRDHPFHRDEQVRIGRVVHALYSGSLGCTSARIAGHPDEKGPDEETGRVYLAVDPKPHAMVPRHDGVIYVRQLLPKDDTWHWPRACPFEV